MRIYLCQIASTLIPRMVPVHTLKIPGGGPVVGLNAIKRHAQDCNNHWRASVIEGERTAPAWGAEGAGAIGHTKEARVKQIYLKIPINLYRDLFNSAKANHRDLKQEILAILEQAMKSEPQPGNLQYCIMAQSAKDDESRLDRLDIMEDDIQGYLDDGWRPCGGIDTTEYQDQILYHQAIIKEKGAT